MPKRYLGDKDVLLKQLRSEIQEIAKDFGLPIKTDCIHIWRTGKSYINVVFHLAYGQTWTLGQTG